LSPKQQLTHGKEIIIQAFGVRIPAPDSDNDEDSVSSEEPVPIKSKKIEVNPTKWYKNNLNLKKNLAIH